MLRSIGAIETLIVANPFPQDRDGTAVRATLSNAPIEPPLRYVPTRPAEDVYGYRMVVGFGGWPPSGDGYCRNPDLRPRPLSNDVTELHAVLCLGPSPLAEAAARTRRITSPDDPQLAHLATEVLTALIVSTQKLDVGRRR